MISTAQIVETFQNIPGKISLDEAIERLVILERFEKALEEVHEKKGESHESVMKEARKWIQYPK